MEWLARVLVAVVSSLCLLPGAALPQAWPAKPIRVIMTLGAGGGAEPLGRLVGQKLGEALGQPIVFEAQGGAGGAIGAAMVAKAAPDGYTIGFSTPSALVLRKFLAKNVPYDTLRDFTPVILVGETMAAIVSSATLPVNTLAEMVEYARRNPGKLNYGTTGIGTTHHLSGVLIEQLTGIQMVHVPYKSGGDTINALLGGQVQVLFGVLGTMIPQMKTGKVKLLAINGGKRFHRMPDVPLVSEVIKGYDRPPSWVAYVGPAGLPQPIVRRLYEEINKIVTQPEVSAKFEDGGILVDTATPEQFAAFLRENFELTARIMKAAKIEPE